MEGVILHSGGMQRWSGLSAGVQSVCPVALREWNCSIMEETSLALELLGRLERVNAIFRKSGTLTADATDVPLRRQEFDPYEPLDTSPTA